MSEPLDLDALEKVAQAVNPEPWQFVEWGGGTTEIVVPRVDVSYEGVTIMNKEDADYLATFDPPTVLALIARLREAEKRLDGD